MGQCRNVWWSQRGHNRHSMVYTRCMLDKQGYMRGRTHAHGTNIQYLLLLHGKNDFANGLQCYVMRTLPVLLNVKSDGA
jgi:hypothetical protein